MVGIVIVLLVFFIFGGYLLGIIGFFIALTVRKRVDDVWAQLRYICERLKQLEKNAAKVVARPMPAKPPAPQTAPAQAVVEKKSEVPERTEVAPQPFARLVQEPAALQPAEPPTSPSPAYPKAPARSGAVGLESQIGKKVMTGVGAAVIFLSAAFFLKIAFQNSWIGPSGQVFLCALFGVGILGLGDRFLRRGWRILGQCILGLGLAILYVTFFAAHSLYQEPVIEQAPAFALLVIVTICGMTLAILHNAVAIAFCAALGGFLTPIFAGANSRDALFAYVLLLDAGVFAVAWFKQWRALDTLALVGTAAIYAGWFIAFYYVSQLYPALAWLAVFYFLFLFLPFVFALRTHTPVAIERFVMALANAVFAFGFAWLMLRAEHEFLLGFVALGMAAVYVALGTVLRRRIAADGRALFGCMLLAVSFLTLAVPLHLQAHGMTLAWAIEGPVLLALGYRYRYWPVRAFAAAVMAVAIVRLFQAHWPLHGPHFYPLFGTRAFLSAIFVPVAMAAFAWIHHRFRPEGVFDRLCCRAAALGAGILGLVVLDSEIIDWFRNEFGDYSARCVRGFLWVAGAFAYLRAGCRAASTATWGVGSLVLAVALLFCLDIPPAIHLLFVNPRFVVSLLAVLGLFLYGRTFARAENLNSNFWKVGGAIFSWGGIIALGLLLTAEVSQWGGQMATTLTWGMYATALLLVGFLRCKRSLRFAGLGLFGISALKVLIVDLAKVDDLY